MHIDLYQVDAFAQEVFEGNPAAVCPLTHWIDDTILQKIAEANNLSETAFFVPKNGVFELRWFTPAEEVDLCGHATLATAHVLYKHLGFGDPNIVFNTRSGELIVARGATGLAMDFPASLPRAVNPPNGLIEGLGRQPRQVLAAFDYIVLLDHQWELEQLNPDLSKWLDLDLRGVVVTAPGEEQDFVSRCFFPKLSVDEDPVTGSAHCELAPFWQSRLGLSRMIAKQLSQRGGLVRCEVMGDRVRLEGNAVDYMQGRIVVDI